MTAETRQDELSLRAYWEVVVRRRWAVIVVVATCSLVALIGSFVATPRYRATATLQIERRNPDILTFRDLTQVDYSWTAYSDFYQTQYKILGSEPVARKTVERLGLDAHPELGGGAGGRPGLLSRLRGLLPRRGEATPRGPLERATEAVLGRLEVAPVRNSHLVKVSWVSSDPRMAAEVANGVAEAYVQLNLESQYSTSGQAEEFLGNQIGTLKREVAELESSLQDYGEAQRIVSIDDQSNLTLKALQDIGERRTSAQTEQALAEAAWRALLAAPADGLPEVLESNLIAELRQQLATLEAEMGEQSRKFGDDWPGVQNLRSKIDHSRARIEEETERIAGQVRKAAEARYARARAELENLDRLVQTQEGAAQRLKRQSVEYANLQTEATKKRETLNALITRQNEMTLATRLKDLDATSSNIRILDRAKVPAGPFSPDTRSNLAIALLLGLAAGVGLALALDHLDNTVGSAEELKRVAAWPILAVVPHHASGPGGTPALLRMMGRADGDGDGTVDLVAHRDGRGGAAEAFRDLRTAILLSSPGRAPRSLLVTSALPGEGKSATAMNLAVVLAQTGARVLLVDADLRRPRLHLAFECDNRAGLSSFLSGMERDARALVRRTEVEGLDLITSGPVPPNPSELLNAPQFRQLANDLIEAGYDHLVFDSPPALVVSDPVIVASSVESCILVVRAAQTPRASVRSAVEKLGPAAAGTAGLVLNDLDPGRSGGRYYGGAYYGRGETADEAPLRRTVRRWTRRAGGGG